MLTFQAFVDTLAQSPGAPVQVVLPDRTFVPAWFHVTEVGRVQKDFIDCGGTRRSSTACVLQLWVANDTQHRLDASKLAHILRLGAPLMQAADLPVEVEYEHGVVSQYPVETVEATPLGVVVRLAAKHTACLAADRCGVTQAEETACCSTPGCCS